MDKLIASPIVTIPGRHFGHFDVYEIEPGKYKAIPRNKWEGTGPDEYKKFIFYKKGKKWITEPYEYQLIVEQVIEGCGF